MKNTSNKLSKEINDLVFSETTLWLLENRPPEEIRNKLDISWRIEGQSVYLFEIRPLWNKPEVIHHSDFAKVTYIKKSNSWKIYWMRSDLKWHSYKPKPKVIEFVEFLKEIEADPFYCFKG